MGWYKVCDLKDSYCVLDDKYSLWTRHGFEGVKMQKHVNTPDGLEKVAEIEIPREILIELVAEEIRDKRISDLEQQSDEEILGF